MPTETFTSNSYKQFYVLLNTNQIKLYTYPDLLRQNPLLRKFLTSETTAYFLAEAFYQIHIPLFSITFSLKQSLKPRNIARIKSSIIHLTQQLNFQSSLLKLVKLSYLVGSFDKGNVYLYMTFLALNYAQYKHTQFG